MNFDRLYRSGEQFARLGLKGSETRANVGLVVMVSRQLALWFAVILAALVIAFAPAAGAQTKCRAHTVAEGHSLWKIAKRYNVTVQAIQAQNGLEPGVPIKPGQVLEIPPRNGTCGSAKKPPGRPPEKPGKPAEEKPAPDKPAKSEPVVAPPPSWTQTQKTAQERGVNPCNTPNPGSGIYESWDRSPSMGQMIAPQRGGITRSGQFDVMFHFHGHEPVRKEWVQVMDGAVLVGLTLGIGSGPYESVFRDSQVFPKLLRSVEAAMAKKTGNEKARVRKVGLSAWSAGYGAVGEILRTSYGKQRVDSVILLDGLHCGYTGKTLNESQLQPFVDFADQAARGNKFMFVSHSSIIPPGYASTTETANFLIDKQRGRPRSVRPRGSDPMGLDLIARYTRGNFHVRGYQGNDKMDHCAHIGLLRDVLKVHIKRRWQSPKGRTR